jgi:hypothetical protein
MSNDLAIARTLHEQAKRRLRRLDEERARRGPFWAVRQRSEAGELVKTTLARLEALEATQHVETLEGSASEINIQTH